MRKRLSVFTTRRSRYAEVISTACEGTTRKYRLLNQHDTEIRQWPFLDDDMVVDAIAARLVERPVRDLVHPHRARCRPVNLERLVGHAKAPVGPRHRIARSLDLRQRSQQVGRDDGGGVTLENGPVFIPGFRRRLQQHAAEREEQFGRLAQHLVGIVQPQPKDECEGEPHGQLRSGRQLPEVAPPAPPHARIRPELQDGEAAIPAFAAASGGGLNETGMGIGKLLQSEGANAGQRTRYED